MKEAGQGTEEVSQNCGYTIQGNHNLTWLKGAIPETAGKPGESHPLRPVSEMDRTPCAEA